MSLEMELRKRGVLRSMQDLQIFWDHMLSQEDDTETSVVATAGVDRGQQGVLACMCVYIYACMCCVLYIYVCVCALLFVSRLFKYTARVCQLSSDLRESFPSYYTCLCLVPLSHIPLPHPPAQCGREHRPGRG